MLTLNHCARIWHGQSSDVSGYTMVYVEVVTVLLDKGAEVNALTVRGQNALQGARLLMDMTPVYVLLVETSGGGYSLQRVVTLSQCFVSCVEVTAIQKRYAIFVRTAVPIFTAVCLFIV